MMERTNSNQQTKRCAVVTGSNKGIGLEICRQLASNGIMVVLTARDQKRGIEAVESLKTSGFLDNVVFHQLDVKNPASIASLASFIETHFGKLDILVNNAGEIGLIIDPEDLRTFLERTESGDWLDYGNMDENDKIIVEKLKQPYEKGEDCLKTNYYGTKRVTEALLPLLQLSNSTRIVNVSSIVGQLKLIHNEKIKAELDNIEDLTEERLDELLQWYLKDLKEDMLEANGWPLTLSAYKVSKAAINAYTRILAKKFPKLGINCVHPGYVKTNMSGNTGILTAEEGAKAPVKLALLADDGPSGLFFDQMEVSCAVVTRSNKGIGLEICRQLASNGIMVVLTARDEKRGIEAVESLKTSGFLDNVVFHQLDVQDPASIASLASFIETHFRKLDILVNNAGEGGVMFTDPEVARTFIEHALNGDWLDEKIDENDKKLMEKMKQTCEKAEDCLKTNYYGTKLVTEALLPLLQLSNSTRIVNVSSMLGQLKFITNEKVKVELDNSDYLIEERLDDLLQLFLKDFKEDMLEANGWPLTISAYKVSKSAINAYTRILAKKFPKLGINCVHPGYVKTDITGNTGILTAEEGARALVKLALLADDDGPSGLFFDQMEVSTF
ncbi:(+)-neomenthol dehydrogenase-like [Telopea speciosissima]|uniref:(+)-neomenthol dehydrogenase-like n=1 Tax=Telopea speciosissima TaxID=54955 RepID=UPI001CC36749|nr:(+)-neomenthol dehydrogenase-like [Telopea speciosissima]